jgi:hypothetical protein
MMPRGIRIPALILGSIWFLPVSCTTGLFVTYPLVTKSHEHHMSRGDVPHSLFTVVWEPGAEKNPFGFARLDALAPAEKSPARTFLMTQRAGRFEGGRREIVAYQVVSSTAAAQLIEVTWTNDTYGGVSRYRATRTEVKPEFSKVEAPDILIKALLMAMAIAVAVLVAGRLLRRLTARGKADGDVPAPATPSS